MNIFKHFSGRTLLLILGLLVVTSLLIFLALQPPQLNKTTTVTPTKPPVAFTTLAFASPSTSSGSLTTQSATIGLQKLNVTIDTHQNTVTGAQLEIAYDPQVLSNVNIVPGDFLPNGFELIKNIDTTNGRISYALAIPPTGSPKTGTGTVAVISYSVLPTALVTDSGQARMTTTLSFLPKTQVSQLGTIESVLKATQNYTLQLAAKQTTTIPAGSQSAH